MGETKNEVKKYNGYKLYKINDDDSVTMVRITHVAAYNNRITYKDLNTGKEYNGTISDLKGYTPLEPVGLILALVVGIDADDKTYDDVIISGYRLIDLKLDINIPYVICRQSVNDFFASVVYPDKNIAGVSVTRENYPAEINYAALSMASTVYHQEFVHIYYEDTIDEIIECLNIEKYDKTLKKSFDEYIDDMGMVNKKNLPSINGWCKDLRTLLIDNNFEKDIDEMREIEAVDFNLEDHLIDNKIPEGTKGLDPDILEFLRVTHQIPAVSTMVVKYDHDIDLAEFNNTNYMKIRDKAKNLYIVVYRCEGQFLEKEIEDWKNKKSISDDIRLAFYNKYHGLTTNLVK